MGRAFLFPLLDFIEADGVSVIASREDIRQILVYRSHKKNGFVLFENLIFLARWRTPPSHVLQNEIRRNSILREHPAKPGHIVFLAVESLAYIMKKRGSQK